MSCQIKPGLSSWHPWLDFARYSITTDFGLVATHFNQEDGLKTTMTITETLIELGIELNLSMKGLKANIQDPLFVTVKFDVS